MLKTLKRIRHVRLFSIMFLFTVIIIIGVSITITWTTINMSENFFIEKYSLMNGKVMNRIQNNLESFDNQVVLASNNLLQSETIKQMLSKKYSDSEKMSAYYTLGQKMQYIHSLLQTDQLGIFILGSNGTVYASNRSFWPVTDEQLKRNSVTRNTLEKPKWLLYQYDESTPSFGSGKYIVASRAFMDRGSGQVYGSMYFALPESLFRNFYSSYTSPGNNVYLVNKEGIVVSSSDSELIGQKQQSLLRFSEEMKQNGRKFMIQHYRGKDQIVLADEIPYLNMSLINLVDKQEAIGDLIDKKAIAMIVMMIVLAALAMVYFFSRRLTNSLSRLVRQISNSPKSDFTQYVAESGIYETRQIGKAFNTMLDELKEYVDKLLLAQKQQRNAELAALQQQINPHFLYNTLTTIKFMVHLGDKAGMEATISALISLLQNTIGSVSETITVQQELDNLKNYVFINQKRYGTRIKVNYFAFPDCLDVPIPKLILQPFVENAFFHGFSKKQEGTIHILIWQEEEKLICEVVDNGDGMEARADGELPKTNRKQQLFSGIGIKNVHERIQLIYGDPFGVSVTSELGRGTKVRIELPVPQI